ncbi:alpha/beta hydrolase family protein [Leptospira ilyithenensis]|uniref:Alpha/beta fold hydrolase n=1 Tax=Leptospira ilyithenensis TaxID=2484901 RepID=A0A4R9LQS8_9LEPT|nr:alpha/beta fold hydrolase [Leptospira ilyithenensis]TGN10112.1 alpha/beta fold hydrolase [Leptospira ilyithenensis]
MKAQELHIKARDGYNLVGTHFVPDSATAKKNSDVIVINSAVGVRRSFYGPLAKFLSQNGYHVFLLDCRGIGDSGDPKSIDEGIYTWAILDLNALFAHIEEIFPKSNLHVLGHSGGGWLMGFIRPPKNLKSMILLNVGDGYYGSFSFPKNITLYLVWKYMIPAEVRKHGVLPTSKRYYGVPLPKNIALSWAEYGLKKGFTENKSMNPYAKYFQDYTVPALAYSFSDDTVLSLSAIRVMNRRFSGLNLLHKHIQPKEIGEKEMGHFGFIKPGQKKKLWLELVDWLNQISHSVQKSSNDESKKDAVTKKKEERKVKALI